MMVSENLRYELTDRIGVFTLCGSPGNLLPAPDFLDPETLSAILERDEPKGLIIHGAGRNFSAGADLPKLYSQGEDPGNLHYRMDRGAHTLSMIENLDIPVIAAINGICFGGGLEIALACHIRIAAANALFAFPEVNHNLIPGLGGIKRTDALITKISALTLILGGDMVNAEEALKLGIVDRLAPANAAREEGLKLMMKMTSGRSLRVIKAVMRTLNNVGKLTPADAYAEEIRSFCSLAAAELLRRKTEERS